MLLKKRRIRIASVRCFLKSNTRGKMKIFTRSDLSRQRVRPKNHKASQRKSLIRRLDKAQFDGTVALLSRVGVPPGLSMALAANTML